jgi:RHS repeat-associated protein
MNMLKRKIYKTAFIPVLFLSAGNVCAQVTDTRNNVVSNTITQPGITTQLQVDAVSADYKQQQVGYIDGLRRPLQTVLTQANPAKKDIVSPAEFDNYGREIKKFLPYADISGITYGSMHINVYAEQSTFYNPATTTNTIAKDIHPYAQTFTEFSPESRPRENGAPGETWQPGNNHTVQPLSLLNTATDSIKRWTVTYVPAGWGSYTMAGAYAANDLYKTILSDEHGKQVIEFKDREGKVLLKKVQLTAVNDNGSGSGYTGWLCTYYIYDDFNNLRCVIQPRGVEILSTFNFQFSTSLLDEQCFRYEYDARQRMIMKKVPGAGEVYMVYDARDRVVMTQDANLRTANKWMCTVYDIQNRPVLTGLLLNTWSGNKTFLQHLTDAYSSTAYPFTYAAQPTLTYWEALTETHYDNYNTIPGGMDNSFVNLYVIAANFITSYNTAPYYAQPVTASVQTTGFATWAQVKVLGTAATWLVTVTLYDDDGRPLQVKTQNITGGVDVVTMQYDFAGKLLRTHLAQQKAGLNADIYQILTKNEYDHAGRLIAIKKTVSSNTIAGTEKIIVQNTYDELGQLKTKKLAPAYNSNAGLETLNYDYNIRGWMLGVNRDYAKDLNSTNYFGFDLGYDKANNNIIGSQTYTTPQYNGNIEGMVWKSKGDGEKRKYDFSYDAANRLLKADFTQYTGSTFNITAGIDFSIKMGDGTNAATAYDANGNILQMQQWGLKLNTSSQIDNLSYLYQANSNKLARVTDGIAGDNKLGDFKDGTNTGTDDYTYDVNGNLNLDNNKAISSITYNHLNLPSVITVTGKGTIAYTYDAGGNKIKKVTTEGAKITTTLYLGGAVYQNDTLQFIAHEEGRIRFKPISGTVPASLQYDYMLKDHLGNVRMVLTEEIQTNIYPAATLEPALVGTENTFYTIDQTRIVLKSGVTGMTNINYPNNNGITNNNPGCTGTLCSTDNSQNLYKLNSNTNKTGLGITLKVMAGDRLDVFGKSYYFANNPGSSFNNAVPVLDLLAGLLGSPGAAATTGIHGTVNPGLINTAAGTAGINSMFTNQTTQNSATPLKPRAFINIIFFDEQFKAVDYKVSIVGNNSTVKDHTADLQNLTVSKSGFVYIYCSNETPVDVFFDNLQVVHKPGPILEETHYYPFGLTMAGISSKAAGLKPNKEKTFQEQKFDDDLGVNYVQFKWRNHDPQIGKFIEIDPLAEKFPYNSTYAFSENKVISHVELEGLEGMDCRFLNALTPEERDQFINSYTSGVEESGRNGLKFAKTLGIGVLMIAQPEIGFPLAVAEITGVPVTPSPQAFSTTAASELSTVDLAASEMAASQAEQLANRALVLKQGGEIGILDGNANLAVNAETGFFNIQVTVGPETGLITGEININKGTIGFTNLEITNTKGGLGSIEMQNTIGPSTFMSLQKELTELSKAGGFSKGYVEFSRLRPSGSPLPDTDTRTITLFEEAKK